MDVLELKNYITTNYTSTTLNQCSEDDDKNEYLVQNRAIAVFDFDKIKEKESLDRCFPKNVSLTSPDTVVFNNRNEIILIEFKNSFSSDVKKFAVRVKFYETLILLKHRFGFVDLDKLTYILVHKGPKKKSKPHHRSIQGRCPADLSILKHEYPVSVKVYDAKYFDSNCYGILGKALQDV